MLSLCKIIEPGGKSHKVILDGVLNDHPLVRAAYERVVSDHGQPSIVLNRGEPVELSWCHGHITVEEHPMITWYVSSIEGGYTLRSSA
jgi:hypothetical protein